MKPANFNFIIIGAWISLALLISCDSAGESGGDISSNDANNENVNPPKVDVQIPEGYLDASQLSLGELSEFFSDNIKEPDVALKYGKPARRNTTEHQQIILKYYFFGAGRESGESGYYIEGLVIVFSPSGKLHSWEITYEHLYRVK